MKCKLVTQKLTSHNGYQWEVGVKQTAMGASTNACTDGVFHYYSDPLLAVLFNPIHASIENPRLFGIKTSRRLGTDGLKCWCKSQTLVAELPLPKLSSVQVVAFAILVALEAYNAPAFLLWAKNWLSGVDRSAASAAAVARVTAAEAARAKVAASAARVAWKASEAAAVAEATVVAEARAAEAAEAAGAWGQRNKPINFLKIAKTVMKRY